MPKCAVNAEAVVGIGFSSELKYALSVREPVKTIVNLLTTVS
jgi:hypothetical protein